MRPAGLILLSMFLTLCVPTESSAQLLPTEWIETATSVTNTLTDDAEGVDDALPENIAASLNGGTWNLSSGVTYGPPGPPQVTVTAQGTYTSGSLTYLLSSATCSIDFQIQVTQTSPPPVPVSVVPVTITAMGSVSVSGSVQLYPYANVSLTVFQNPTFLANEFIYASLGGPTSDSFNLTNTAMFPPGAPLEGTMVAFANVTAEGSPTPGTSATATATVDPTFEIADQTIPGSSASFRDHYTVDYSPGFWALDNTPVENNTTWGRIKRMYQP